MRTAMPSRKRVPTPCASTADAASRVRQAALRREARFQAGVPGRPGQAQVRGQRPQRGAVRRHHQLQDPPEGCVHHSSRKRRRHRGWCRRLCCGRVFACGARYASSSRPAASSWSSSAPAASRLASFANTYSLIFGSVPLGRTITLLPPSTSNSTTLAAGRPFTPCW